MNRSDETLFDPRIASWLEADPNTAPEPVLEVVLAALPAIKQRRVWRVPLVPAIPRTLLAQATLVGMVLLAVAVGFGIWSGGRNLVVPPGASPTQSPSPSPSFEAPTRSPSPSLEARTNPPTGTEAVNGWPRFGRNAPALYSWDASCGAPSTGMAVYGACNWMHNGSGSGDVEIVIFAVAPANLDDATTVTVAGHDAAYRQIDPLMADWTVDLLMDKRIDGRGEEWMVDIDGTTIAIHLTARRGTSQADIDEAHAIVESMTYEPRDNSLGFRLVFELTTDDWDSG